MRAPFDGVFLFWGKNKQELIFVPVMIGQQPPQKRSNVRRVNKPWRKRPLVRLADRIFGQVLAIRKEKMDVILAAIGPRLGLDSAAVPLVSFDPGDFEDDQDDSQDYQIVDGVARIPIFGTLVKRASGIDAQSGLTSYEVLRNQITSAVDDSNVKAILFETDSPGGESDGCPDLSDFIYSLRGVKPMLAIADGLMCSAAYWIASAADGVVCTRTAMLGSIGCFMLHVDQSVRDKQQGYAYSYIQSGQRKIDGNEHEPLNQSARSEMQNEVNRVAMLFASTVARNRGVSIKALLDTEAAVFFGPAACPMFADRLATCDEALAMLGAAMPAPSRYSIEPGDKEDLAEVDDDDVCNPDSPNYDPDNPDCPDDSYPAASRPRRLLDGPRRSAQRLLAAPRALSTDTVSWLARHSNIRPDASLAAAVDRLRSEHAAIAAKYGAGVEARLIAHPRARACPATPGSRRIALLAVPYDGSLSVNLGGFYERYAPGCFNHGLDADPRCLFAHDDRYVIGRKAAQTAQFWEDSAGVHCTADGPAATWFDDLLESIRRGDISQSSAGFWILKAHWETVRGEKVRIVERALLREVAVVSFSAYPNTSAELVPSDSNAVALARIRELRLAGMHPSTANAWRRLEILRLR